MARSPDAATTSQGSSASTLLSPAHRAASQRHRGLRLAAAPEALAAGDNVDPPPLGTARARFERHSICRLLLDPATGHSSAVCECLTRRRELAGGRVWGRGRRATVRSRTGRHCDRARTRGSPARLAAGARFVDRQLGSDETRVPNSAPGSQRTDVLEAVIRATRPRRFTDVEKTLRRFETCAVTATTIRRSKSCSMHGRDQRGSGSWERPMSATMTRASLATRRC